MQSLFIDQLLHVSELLAGEQVLRYRLGKVALHREVVIFDEEALLSLGRLIVVVSIKNHILAGFLGLLLKSSNFLVSLRKRRAWNLLVLLLVRCHGIYAPGLQFLR